MSEKNKLIDTPSFQLKDNTLWFEDYFLQVSNVSQVSAREAPTWPYWYGVVGILAGLFMISAAKALLMGLVLIAASCGFLYYVYTKKQSPEYDLYITLNSGNVFRFHCKSKQFATRVMEALRVCVNTPHASMTVDFHNSKIENSNVMMGKNNTMR